MSVRTREVRAARHLDRLKAFKEKIDKMNSCHIVTYSLSNDFGPDNLSFDADDDGFAHGLDAPGDWNEGFKEIKDGMLKYVNQHIEWAKEDLERAKKDNL